MKNNTYLLFLLGLSCCIGSCKKDKPDISPTDPFIGTGSATLNEKTWICEARSERTFKHDSIVIAFVKRDAQGIVREGLSFQYVPYRIQKNLLSPFELTNFDIVSAYYITILADGDVTGEMYIANSSSSANFIEIQKIDSTNNEIEGRFGALLTIDPTRGKIFPSSPDTLYFTAGIFKVRVKQ